MTDEGKAPPMTATMDETEAPVDERPALSLAALESAPEGSWFEINSSTVDGSGTRWEKGQGVNWSSEGTELPSGYFMGYLRAGLLDLHLPVPPTPAPELARLDDALTATLTSTPSTDLFAEDAPTPTTAPRPVVVSEGLLADLIAHAEHNNDDTLLDVLVSHGIDIGVDQRYTVTARGSFFWTPSVDDARLVLGEQLNNATVERVRTVTRNRVEWYREFEVLRRGRAGVCLCDSVTRDSEDVRAALPPSAEITAFAVTCLD